MISHEVIFVKLLVVKRPKTLCWTVSYKKKFSHFCVTVKIYYNNTVLIQNMAINSSYSIANLLKPSTKPPERTERPTEAVKALTLAEKLAGKYEIYCLVRLNV